MTRRQPRKPHGEALAIQSPREEAANVLIHGAGLGLSIAGLCVLVAAAARGGSAWHVVGSAVFGASLVILYLTSTLYHGLRGAHLKRVLRLLDHISIYILIAGSYTPFTLTVLRGALGWTLFGLVWGLAAAGIAVKAVFGFRYDVAATLGYILMGWLILIAIVPVVRALPAGGLALLGTGGGCYTLGIPFYFLDTRIRYFHSVWHLFVVAGSICHFFVVLLYLVPDA